MKTFAVFPGQGSQHVGMGKNLFENFSVARDIFEEASDAAKLNLKKLCFDGPESDLTLTENTQPALLAASVAAFRVAETETGFAPDAVAGHSLGEYSALVAARALPLAKAALWVRERGRAMQNAVPPGQGTMAAILGLNDPQIPELCKKATLQARQRRAGASEEYSVEAIVEPANFNAPGQVVIAGSTDAVNEAISLVKTDAAFAGGKAIPLSVSAPFHCRLMAPAKDRMATLFAGATSEVLSLPYVPNRTARLTRESELIFELLVEQIDQPVLWRQSIGGLIEAGYHSGFEFGPGKVLTGLTKRIDTEKRATMAAVGDAPAIQSLETYLKGAGK